MLAYMILDTPIMVCHPNIYINIYKSLLVKEVINFLKSLSIKEIFLTSYNEYTYILLYGHYFRKLQKSRDRL